MVVVDKYSRALASTFVLVAHVLFVGEQVVVEV